MDHECPKTNCGEQLPRGLLACRPHWYEIPKPVRDQVNRTWRAYNGIREDTMRRGVDSTERRSYLEARQAALQCLNG